MIYEYYDVLNAYVMLMERILYVDVSKSLTRIPKIPHFNPYGKMLIINRVFWIRIENGYFRYVWSCWGNWSVNQELLKVYGAVKDLFRLKRSV